MHADLESIVCKIGGDPAICVREEAICASLQTDGQTDRQADDGRRAIALAYSWNELKIISPSRLNAFYRVKCWYFGAGSNESNASNALKVKIVNDIYHNCPTLSSK